MEPIGFFSTLLGDLARARQLWEQALEIYEAIEAPNAKWVRDRLDELARGNAP